MKLIALTLVAASTAFAVPIPGHSQESVQAERQAGVTDPLAFVRATYDAYQSGTAPVDPSHAYSPGLRRLIDAALEEQKDEPGRLDFDFWIAGQDWVIEDLAITEQPGVDGARVVGARFRNQGVPAHLLFTFVQQGGRWFLDDVRNTDGPEANRYHLRRLLTEPPIGGDDGWVNFYHGPDGSIGDHRAGVVRDGEMLRVDVRARQWESPGGTSEGLFLIELDCAGKRSRMLRGKLTSDHGETQERNEAQQWEEVIASAPSGALHAKLCTAR